MNATKVVLDWIVAHPYQTAFQVVNGVIICTPAAATVPVLAALGFGAGGPIAGSAAAAVMSWFGTVPAGGLYAIFQSAAMGGYGASAAAGLAQAGAVLSSVGGWFFSRNQTAN
ncbi:uncharacterized protein M421DRAFT_180541 [Didymella exigua CBS 183.55]|uniref:Uncharacterized protein n=1 Tax=Didymella exigua CBS 183.55 TaxID=1150837 RepID=A0A6A5RPR4_9PLEO|nr:uncharacterized protein M421DRAFT_180541 [Didymella exigua CBS 183.55]KAF1927477.1 hypothetical protein M421DRAFT_180541 [Didymella exigua CBS 183.55]